MTVFSLTGYWCFNYSNWSTLFLIHSKYGTHSTNGSTTNVDQRYFWLSCFYEESIKQNWYPIHMYHSFDANWGFWIFQRPCTNEGCWFKSDGSKCEKVFLIFLKSRYKKKTLTFILIPFLFKPCCRNNEKEWDMLSYVFIFFSCKKKQ